MASGSGSGGGSPGSLPPEALVQLRVGFLTILQGIISRMAGYSAAVKNFSITVTAASVALAYQQHEPNALKIGLGAVVFFAFVDAYYLGLERAFRELYGTKAARPLAEAEDLTIARPPASTLRALFSLSVFGFYAPQAIVAGGLLIYNCWRGQL